MKKLRWFHLKNMPDIDSLSKEMSSNRFTPESEHGFILDIVREDFIQGRYVEKLVSSETIADPYGIEYTQSRTIYQTCNFVVSTTPPELEILNSPKNTQSFLSALSKASFFSIAVAPIKVDAFLWAKLFLEGNSKEYTVESVQIGALKLNESVTAKSVVKGKNNVIEACQTLANGKPINYEKVKIKSNEVGQHFIEFTQIGSARTSNNTNSEENSKLRNSLIKAASLLSAPLN